MKHAFEQFAAWRLALPPARPALGPRAQDEQARQRWDSEGGNPGTPLLRRKRDRANLLARNRRATSLESKETAWKLIAVTAKG